jgi:predicted nucleic-acid-binding Zn-ribbon protein
MENQDKNVDDQKAKGPIRDQIIEALTRVGATNVCPRCSNNQFAVIESVAIPIFASNTVNLSRSLPLVVAACTKCGFVSLHSYGVLGLPFSESKKEDEK